MRAFDFQDELGVRGRMEFVEPCRWDGTLYDIGPFPGAVPGAGTIHGELFRLDSPEVWTVLDQYEGYDPDQPEASPFVRRRVELAAPDVTAWVYWYNGDPTSHPRVSSGSWATYLQKRDAS